MSWTAAQESRRSHRPKSNALQYAVKLLSARPYSEKKLREKLTGREYLPDEIAAAVKRLKEEHLLDDRNYAEEFVRARLTFRPRTGIALLRDLLQRGISKRLAQEVIAELAPPEQEESLARDLVRRKWPLYQSLDDQSRRRRLMGLLARRGFGYDTIEKVLKSSPGSFSDDETSDVRHNH